MRFNVICIVLSFLLVFSLFSGVYGATWNFNKDSYTSLSDDPNTFMVHKGDIVNLTFLCFQMPQALTWAMWESLMHAGVKRVSFDGYDYSQALFKPVTGVDRYPLYLEAIKEGNLTMTENEAFPLDQGSWKFTYQIVVLPK